MKYKLFVDFLKEMSYNVNNLIKFIKRRGVLNERRKKNILYRMWN